LIKQPLGDFNVPEVLICLVEPDTRMSMSFRAVRIAAFVTPQRAL
jgi:hypothetical protein